MACGKTVRVVLALLVLVSFSGAYVSGVLLTQHEGGWQASSAGTGFLLRLCEPQLLDSPRCANVISSPFGGFDVYWGGQRFVFPTSFLGVAYFLAFAIWNIALFVPFARRQWFRLLTTGYAICGFLVSILLVAVMAISIGEWCTLCLIAHGANALILVGVVALMNLIPVDRPAKPESRATDRQAGAADSSVKGFAGSLQPRLALVTFTAILACVLGVWSYFHGISEAQRQWRKAKGYAGVINSLQSDVEFLMREFYAQPIHDVPVRSSDAHSSSSGKPVQIMVFNDFDHGGNACFNKSWKTNFARMFGDLANIDYRNRPENLVDAVMAGESPSVQFIPALAAEAARIQGGNDGLLHMQDLLFELRKKKRDWDAAKLATLCGLHRERFSADMASEGAWGQVVEDIELSQRLGVESAPAVFLNGRRVPDLCLKSYEFWRAVAKDIKLAYGYEETEETLASVPSGNSALDPNGRMNDEQP
ncbi:MAG: vitamin K epoxide reductase family protein [Planctomycetota bacterium]